MKRLDLLSAGAREHYAVPRALQRQQALEMLAVDCWCPPGSLSARVSARFRSRYHSGLENARVHSFNAQTLGAELKQRIFPAHWYDYQYESNQRFQDACVKVLERLPADFSPRAVFAFSYAAKKILAYARGRGWKTILGQVDPGPRETEIVVQEYRRLGLSSGTLYEPPLVYWADLAGGDGTGRPDHRELKLVGPMPGG